MFKAKNDKHTSQTALANLVDSATISLTKIFAGCFGGDFCLENPTSPGISTSFQGNLRTALES